MKSKHFKKFHFLEISFTVASNADYPFLCGTDW